MTLLPLLPLRAEDADADAGLDARLAFEAFTFTLGLLADFLFIIEGAIIGALPVRAAIPGSISVMVIGIFLVTTGNS